MTEDKTAVFTSKYKEPSYLDILNSDNSILSINLSKILGFDTDNSYKCYFNLGIKFGIIHRSEELLLFDTNNSNDYEIVKISNPFKPDKYGIKTCAERASTFLINNKLLFGLADYRCYGYPPRYLAYLEIEKKISILGLGVRKTTAKWAELIELPKKYFPETEFSKFQDNRDWLNIRALTQIENNILIHTTGGTSTRLKSGKAFEFNIIAKFDSEFKWIENFEVEKGFGRFSTDKKSFIQHPSNYRNKLFFYSTENSMKIDFKISLTAKQNLGNEKANQIQADKVNDIIFIYNHRFLNICKLTD
nr:hypothetical protein [Pedobacter kyonggii]